MNLISRTFRSATVPLILAALAGCASSPPSVLLALPAAVAPATAVRQVTSAMPVLAIGRLDLPEYLVSKRVRYKVDATTVGEWPETFWAERIEVGATREFVAALQRQLPAWRVCDANCSELLPAAALQVAVIEMDYLRSAARLHGKVRITVGAGGGSGASKEMRGEERVYDVAANGDTAQAQAQAVTELLRRIAVDAAALVLSRG